MKLAWILWLSNMLPQPAADSLCLSTTVYLEARSVYRIAGPEEFAFIAHPGTRARTDRRADLGA